MSQQMMFVFPWLFWSSRVHGLGFHTGIPEICWNAPIPLRHQDDALKNIQLRLLPKYYQPLSVMHPQPSQQLQASNRGENLFSSKGHFDFYSPIHRPCKITNLKLSLLNLAKHLITSPLMPWPGQTNDFLGLIWFPGPYRASRLDVPHPYSIGTISYS